MKLVMVRLISRYALLAIFPLLSACNGESAPSASVASAANPEQLIQQPHYLQDALKRASELSPNPEVLVLICETEAKKNGYTNNALINYVHLCVEDAGMD